MPITKRLRTFVSGSAADGDVRAVQGHNDSPPSQASLSPWSGAGYSDSGMIADRGITDASVGGAFSTAHTTILLGIKIVHQPTVRVFSADAVSGLDGVAPAVPFDGGDVLPRDVSEALSDALFDAASRVAHVQVLCGSAGPVVGAMRFMRGEASWRPSRQFFIEPNTARNRDCHPNRIDLVFGDGSATVRVEKCVAEQLCDGEFVVLDMDVCADVASITIKEDSFVGVDEVDVKKIAEWLTSFHPHDADNCIGAKHDDLKLAMSLVERIDRTATSDREALRVVVESFTQELLRIEAEARSSQTYKSPYTYR